MIIDSDAGVDDANAILMALGSPDVDVIAITTVSGNTTAPQSGRNVLRVLQLMNRLDVSIIDESGLDARKPVFWVSDKARLKPVSSATENS